MTPDGGVERVAEFTLERQRDSAGRLRAPEPSSANPGPTCRGFDNEVRQSAAPDQRAVFLAQDREMTERELLMIPKNGSQPRGRLLG
jgi:hypothetical protein